MAGWITFKLGRPGGEYEFTVPGNPAAISIDERNVKVVQTNIEGDLRKSILKTHTPSVGINSNYLPIAERNKLSSLLSITDTFFSFQIRDDLQVIAEKAALVTLSTVNIANSSMLRLEQALYQAGAIGHIAITGVFDNPAGSGTDYYAGGSFASGTGLITLGTPLVLLTTPVYISYTYKGWLMELDSMSDGTQGGRVDLFTYDISLAGA